MSYTVHKRIEELIVDTNDAFSFCGSVNTDYAEFAALSIHDFKRALSDPNLTRARLVSLLRQGSQEHPQHGDVRGWAYLMARYMARTANSQDI